MLSKGPQKLHGLEEFKYLPPKFSWAYFDLWELYEIPVEDKKTNQDFNSVHTFSVISKKNQRKQKSSSHSSTGSVKKGAGGARLKNKDKSSDGNNSSVYSSGSSKVY